MRIGFWWFELYTLKVAAGVLVALFWLWWNAPRRGFDRRVVLTWLFLLTFVALTSGRLGYVLGNRAYFSQHPTDIFRWRRIGGMHGSSAIAGGLLVVASWARVMNTPPHRMLCLLSPPLLCVAAATWWGCADVGCAWGREVVVATGLQRLFVAQMPDIYRMLTQRYAVQALGAVLALGLAVAAVVLRERGGLALSFYLLASAGLTLLRADPVPAMGVVRVDTAVDLALAGIVGMMVGLKRDARSIRP